MKAVGHDDLRDDRTSEAEEARSGNDVTDRGFSLDPFFSSIQDATFWVIGAGLCREPPTQDPALDPAQRHFRRSPAGFLLRVPLE